MQAGRCRSTATGQRQPPGRSSLAAGGQAAGAGAARSDPLPQQAPPPPPQPQPPPQPRGRPHSQPHHQAGVPQHGRAGGALPQQVLLAPAADQHQLLGVLQQEPVPARHGSGQRGKWRAARGAAAARLKVPRGGAGEGASCPAGLPPPRAGPDPDPDPGLHPARVGLC